MKTLEIARISILRTFRDRMGLFFIVVLPMILVIVLGVTYGGMNGARIGVADADGSKLSTALIAGIDGSDIHLDIRTYATSAELRDAVERGFVELGIAVPAGYDAALRSGGQGRIELIGQPRSYAPVVRTAVESAIARQRAVVSAARFASQTDGVSFDEALIEAGAAQPGIAGMSVAMESVADAIVNPNGFAVGAQSQVILFMFLSSMTGAAVLVSTRTLGISRREFSTPTSVRAIIAGEALGRFVFALFQGGFIVVASSLLFGVNWIDLPATAAIVIAFAAVASGAAMLVGSLVRNEHQVAALGPGLGMLFGLLGGTMVPPEVFPSIMRTLSHVTPHAWAMDAFHQLLLRGGGFVDVLPQVGVLTAFAMVVLGLAVLRFRRVIAG
jgi:ABC-2 type transport system permease protein